VNAVPKAIQAPALTADGKPRVLYVGAEYCPYCAAQRWGLVVALSRFGIGSGLGQTHSSSSDVFPNTATLSFQGATYTSRYASFTGHETTTNELAGGQYKPLDTPSATDEQIFNTYDRPPYVEGSGGVPFVDVGGAGTLSGASSSPELLGGKTHEQIAAALSDPASPIAKAIDGTANVFTAAISTMTKDTPGSVCSSSGVKAAAVRLAVATNVAPAPTVGPLCTGSPGRSHRCPIGVSGFPFLSALSLAALGLVPVARMSTTSQGQEAGRSGRKKIAMSGATRVPRPRPSLDPFCAGLATRPMANATGHAIKARNVRPLTRKDHSNAYVSSSRGGRRRAGCPGGRGLRVG
jgi:hypothetical protein